MSTPVFVGPSTDLPSWIAEGARVRVKRTWLTRHHGLGTFCPVPPGTVGRIERREWNGCWDWKIIFDAPANWSWERNGQPETWVRPELLEHLAKVRS